jgi:hypothetical protein
MQHLEFPDPFNSRERTMAVMSGVDWLVLAVILVIGAIQFTYYPHAADFLNDPGYPDMARSILDHGSYRFDYLPETTLPPGFPVILAVAGWFFGLSPAVLFRVIAVFTTLGLIIAYRFLRQIEGRGVAAGACLLLGSSPSLFSFNTAVIFPEMPFFFASMLALLLTLKIDRKPGRTPVAWTVVLGVALVLAVLIRSVGIALLVGLGTWIVISLLVMPEIGRRRLTRFLLPLVLGAAAQAGWSTWAQRHQVLEWQLPGYPESYASQLKIKDGQHPELGLAHIADIPSRIERNIVMRTALLGQLLTGRYISTFWSSPAMFGVLLLIALGLSFSFRNGGQLYDWYFLWTEVIFLLWPWDPKPRFLYPTLPLAFLYLWRGARVIRYYSIRQPRVVGLCALLFGSVLAITSAAVALRMRAFNVDLDHPRGDHLQPIAAAAFWAILTVFGFAMFKFDSGRNKPEGAKAPSYLNWIAGLEVALPLRIVGILVLTTLVGSGLEHQLVLGRSNMNLVITQQSTYPEIAAAEWIRTHEPASRVIMARDQDMLFHYTGRRVVWFPPISDPKLLMDGIRRHGVGMLVVAHHSGSYWLPPEDVCFQSLAQAYGSAFHVVNHGRDYQVFEVTPR